MDGRRGREEWIAAWLRADEKRPLLARSLRRPPMYVIKLIKPPWQPRVAGPLSVEATTGTALTSGRSSVGVRESHSVNHAMMNVSVSTIRRALVDRT